MVKRTNSAKYRNVSDTGKPTSRDVFNHSTDPVKDCNTHMCTVEHVKVKVKVTSYIAQYSIIRIAQSAFYTLLPGRPIHLNIILTSLGSIQPHGNFVKAARTQIFTTVYSQVLIHTAE